MYILHIPKADPFNIFSGKPICCTSLVLYYSPCRSRVWTVRLSKGSTNRHSLASPMNSTYLRVDDWISQGSNVGSLEIEDPWLLLLHTQSLSPSLRSNVYRAQKHDLLRVHYESFEPHPQNQWPRNAETILSKGIFRNSQPPKTSIDRTANVHTARFPAHGSCYSSDCTKRFSMDLAPVQ